MYFYSSKFLFHVIELSKLNEADDYEKQEELYHWAKLIAADRWEDICMEAKGNPYRELVQEELEKIRQDETERWLYLREEMALMDERCRLNTAMHQGLNRGRTEGLAEGLDRGRTEGHTQGLQQMQILTQKLLQDNRIEDLKKASEDENYLQKLMEEYRIL
ncbi:MAG: PD-(D/E)XK nuclease family transposase [Schaedlerella sp.]|nr:PD-(D/E)XK nuclease family transposase [Lachnospiraceae bacterium]MDY4201996.1 PD-(D/E)XK nuclease family transposase [Schaedlerella sp.]